MAVDAYALDHLERTFFFRRNAAGVPIQLPFDLVTIDGEQYYEPHSMDRVGANGQPVRGAVTGCVFVKRNGPLPKPEGTRDLEKFAVFSYYGV